MSERSGIVVVDTTKKTAQDAPGTPIGTSVDLQVPLISTLAYPQSILPCLNVVETFRAVEDGVDAVVPVDAQNASTSDLENCRQFSTASTPIIVCFGRRRTKNE
jgi:hypothetical protein